MKGIASILWTLVALGIVIFTGYFLIGTANIFPASVVVDWQTCTAKEGLSLIPIMGYYECKEQGETSTMYEISTGWGWDPQVVIPCNEYTRSCQYYKCENLGCTGTQTSLGSAPMGGAYQTPHQLYKYYIKKTFKPYSLWIESRTGNSGWVYTGKTYQCQLPAGKDYCLGGVLCDPSRLYKAGTIDFDQATNFLEQWAVSPVEYSLKNHPTYGQVYCAGLGTLYSYNSIKLTSGCYIYPSSQIGKADCCPGQVLGSAKCGDDFKWKTPDVVSQCMSDFQCTGQGTWVADYIDINRKTVTSQKCINGKCVAQTKKTTCATNEACPTGTICMLDPYTGTSSCSSSGTPPTSPRTPTIISPPAPNELMNWLINIIVSFIIGAVLTGILLVLSIFTPLRMLPPLRLLRNKKVFLMVSFGIGLLILVFYAGIVLSVKGMLI